MIDKKKDRVLEFICTIRELLKKAGEIIELPALQMIRVLCPEPTGFSQLSVPPVLGYPTSSSGFHGNQAHTRYNTHSQEKHSYAQNKSSLNIVIYSILF